MSAKDHMACLTIHFFTDSYSQETVAGSTINAKMDVVSRKSGHGQKLIRGSSRNNRIVQEAVQNRIGRFWSILAISLK